MDNTPRGLKYKQVPRCAQTHLRLNNKNLNHLNIESYSNLCNVTQLYLHCNKLESVTGICILSNLTHLYLQWNNIASIKDLNNLPNLQKLYLGYNCINPLEGLYGMKSIRLIHIQKQKLNLKQPTLMFDQGTISHISATLRELNVSSNGITSVFQLQNLSFIEYLDISDNFISNLQETCSVISKMKHLREIVIKGNPITKNFKYMEELISARHTLEKINETCVSPLTRKFIYNFKTVKDEKQKRRPVQKIKFSPETRSLLHHLPVECRKIVSQSIIHERENYTYKKN